MNSLEAGTQRNDLHRLENIPFRQGCEAVLQLEKGALPSSVMSRTEYAQKLSS
jgi:hypothetical protein